MHCNFIVIFLFFHACTYIFLWIGQCRWNQFLYSLVSTFITCTPIMPLEFSWKQGTEMQGEGTWPAVDRNSVKGLRKLTGILNLGMVRCLSCKTSFSLVSAVTILNSDTGPYCREMYMKCYHICQSGTVMPQMMLEGSNKRKRTMRAIMWTEPDDNNWVWYSIGLLHSSSTVSAVWKANVSACWQNICKNFNDI